MKKFLVTLGLMHISNAITISKIKKITNSTATKLSTSTTTISNKCCCFYKFLLLLLLLLLPLLTHFVLKVTGNETGGGNSSSNICSLTIKTTAVNKGGGATVAKTPSTATAAIAIFGCTLLHFIDFVGSAATTNDNSSINKVQLYRQLPHRLQYNEDNKTNDNNFDSNIAKIIAANTTPIGVVVVANKVVIINKSIIFYSVGMLALLSLLELLAIFVHNKKKQQAKSQQQHKSCQAFFNNVRADEAKSSMATTITTTTTIKLAAAAATTSLYAALVLAEDAALTTVFSVLFSSKTFALYTTLLTMKTTTTTRPATAKTINKVFNILSLLQQISTQQQHQKQQEQHLQRQYNTSNQQPIIYNNCSKYCGNMYQQKQHQQLKLKISAHQQHLVTIHILLLFHKQFALFSQLIGAAEPPPLATFYCKRNQRIRRHRRRKRKLFQLIRSNSNNTCCTSCNLRQQRKHIKQGLATAAAATTMIPNVAEAATVTESTARKYCKNCCYSSQNQRTGREEGSENSANASTNCNNNTSDSDSCSNRPSNNNDKNDSPLNDDNSNNDNSGSSSNSSSSSNSNSSSSRRSNSNGSRSSNNSNSGADSNNNNCYVCYCRLCCCYCHTYHCSSDCFYCCYCCCCCCCCCWYYCCYCCCCCCSFRHCRCCCLCCGQLKANNENNNINANSKINNNSNNKNSKYSGFKIPDNSNWNSCCNNNNSSNKKNGTNKQYSWRQQKQKQQQKQQHYHYHHQKQHQQHQQHNYKEYYQQQHKRQQQQHLFYQQHNCYHRRRRRHFCASYTSLHSCCCCFFKWICWRHQNHHSCHTATAKTNNNNANIVCIFQQQLFSLTSQQKQQQTETNAVATYRYSLLCNEKWQRSRCYGNSVSETLKQQQQKKSQQSFAAKKTVATTTATAAAVPKRPTATVATKTKDVLLNLSAFLTITATAISTLTTATKKNTKTPTATTISTRIFLEKGRSETLITTSSPSSTAGRMCRRLPFRCSNWLWLLIGLVWLEGPKLAACNTNNSWQVSNNNNNSNSTSNDSVGNNRTAVAAETLNYTSTAAITTATATIFNNCSSSNSSSSSCTQHTKELFHININQMLTRQKQRFPRRVKSSSAAATATMKIQGHKFNPIAVDSIEWSDLSAKAREAENRQQSDDIRLESIKRQILTRLGLKRKPNVTHPLPKQFIWDTIYRADGISSVIDFDFNDDHRQQRIISSRDREKFVKYTTTTVSLQPFNEATASRKTTATTNSRVTRAYSSFLSKPNDANEENGFIGSDSDGYSGDIIIDDVDNSDDKRYNEYENQQQTFIYQRKQQQQQQNRQKHHLRYPKEKTRLYLNNGRSDGGYGTVHTDQSKKFKVSNDGNSEQQQQHDDWERNLYEQEEFYGITQEIILFAEKGKMYKKHRLVEFSPPKHDIPSRQLQIRHAEIHIRIERSSLPMSMQQRRRRNTNLKLWIFQLVDGGDYTQRGFDQVARLCASLNVEQHTLGWQKLDLTKTVQLWYDQLPGEKLRLLIDCTGCGQHYVLHLFDVQNQTAEDEQQQRRKAPPHQHGIRKKHQQQEQPMKSKNESEPIILRKQHHTTWSSKKNNNYKNNKRQQNKQLPDHFDYKHAAVNADSKQLQAAAMPNLAATEFYHLDDRLNPNRPFLVLHTEPKRARRVRRRVVDCAAAQHGQCCKESFYVSFKALGWDDWIIAPRGYFANYCRGDCSGPYRTPDTFQTFHAHFIEEYRKMGLLNGMQPCCAPIKFSSMSLIYYGDDGIIKRDLPKMVVDECGCP